MNDRSKVDDDDAMQALIGRQLRVMYDSVLSEPVPDKIVDLLAKLEDIPLPNAHGSNDSTNDQ